MKRNQIGTINYLYLLSLALLVCASTLLSIILEPFGSTVTKISFFFETLLQITLLIAFFACLAWYGKKFMGAWGTFLMISVSFFGTMAALANYFLVQIMGTNVTSALGLVLHENIENFYEILKSSNVPMSTWLIGFLGLCAFFSLGPLLYFITKKSSIFQRSLSLKTLFLTSIITTTLLVVCERWIFSQTPHSTTLRYARVLPLETTLLRVPNASLSSSSFLIKLKKPAEKTLVASKEEYPIYLFVIESLRDDFITKKNTPFLHQFKQENTYFAHAISGGNATFLSWFSIFHSKYALHWKAHHYSSGAPPLLDLHKLGYQTSCYSSADLNFYKMRDVIFGKNQETGAMIHAYPHDAKNPPWKADQQCIQQLLKEHKAGKNLYIVFLDCTHFDYSWPQEETLFKPFYPTINYFKGFQDQKDLVSMKNRYRNSLHFVDTLLGSCIPQLEKNAIICITGDHGEEFKEKGQVFHASNLSREQTHVPLYFKFPKTNKPITTNIISHVDIFPTILDIVTDSTHQKIGNGVSIFSSDHPNIALSARYRGSLNPIEFMIHNGMIKMILRNNNHRSTQLLSITDDDDRPIALEKGLELLQRIGYNTSAASFAN